MSVVSQKGEKCIQIESSIWVYKSMRKTFIALLSLLELFLPRHCVFFVKFPCPTFFAHESSYTVVLETIFLEEILLLNSYSCQHFFLQSSNCQVLPTKLEERNYSKCPVIGGGSVIKLCLTLVTPWTIYSLPGPTVHGVFQARVLEWVAISFSRVSSRPRDQICLHCRQILYWWSHQGSPKLKVKMKMVLNS